MPSLIGMGYKDVSSKIRHGLFDLTANEKQQLARFYQRYQQQKQAMRLASATPRTKEVFELHRNPDPQEKNAPSSVLEIHKVAGELYVIEAENSAGRVGTGAEGRIVYYAVKLAELLADDSAASLYTLKQIPVTQQSCATTRHYVEVAVDTSQKLGRPSSWGITKNKPDNPPREKSKIHQLAPYIPGEELFDFITRYVNEAETPLTYLQATRVIHAIAKALAAFHAEGLVHRDIKPENMLIRYNEELTEFEVEIIDPECTVPIDTNDGKTCGTLTYTSVQEVTAMENGGYFTDKYDMYAFSIIASRVYCSDCREPRFWQVEELVNYHPDKPTFDEAYYTVAQQMPLCFSALLRPDTGCFPENNPLIELTQDFLTRCGAEKSADRPKATDAVEFFAACIADEENYLAQFTLQAETSSDENSELDALLASSGSSSSDDESCHIAKEMTLGFASKKRKRSSGVSPDNKENQEDPRNKCMQENYGPCPLTIFSH